MHQPPVPHFQAQQCAETRNEQHKYMTISTMRLQVEDMMEQADYELKPGDKVVGTVYECDEDGAYVEIGAKSAGFVPLSECSLARLKSVSPLCIHSLTSGILAASHPRGTHTAACLRPGVLPTCARGAARPAPPRTHACVDGPGRLPAVRRACALALRACDTFI